MVVGLRKKRVLVVGVVAVTVTTLGGCGGRTSSANNRALPSKTADAATQLICPVSTPSTATRLGLSGSNDLSSIATSTSAQEIQSLSIGASLVDLLQGSHSVGHTWVEYLWATASFPKSGTNVIGVTFVLSNKSAPPENCTSGSFPQTFNVSKTTTASQGTVAWPSDFYNNPTQLSDNLPPPYYVRACLVMSGGTKSVGLVARVDNKKPALSFNGAPTIIGTAVTLTWTKPTAYAVSGYRLSFINVDALTPRDANGNPLTYNIDANATSFTIPGLAPNSNYSLRFEAINSFDGTASLPDDFNVKTLAALPPNSPTPSPVATPTSNLNGSATPTPTNQLTFNVDAPSTQGKSADMFTTVNNASAPFSAPYAFSASATDKAVMTGVGGAGSCGLFSAQYSEVKDGVLVGSAQERSAACHTGEVLVGWTDLVNNKLLCRSVAPGVKLTSVEPKKVSWSLGAKISCADGEVMTASSYGSALSINCAKLEK